MSEALMSSSSIWTIFTTTKEPTKFYNNKQVDVGFIPVAFDKCAIATVSNDKKIFVGRIVPTKNISIITVRGTK